ETKLGLPLKHINPPRADGAEQVVQILRGMNVVRNQVIHRVVGEIALFLTCINEFRNVANRQVESLQRRVAMEARLCGEHAADYFYPRRLEDHGSGIDPNRSVSEGPASAHIRRGKDSKVRRSH